MRSALNAVWQFFRPERARDKRIEKIKRHHDETVKCLDEAKRQNDALLLLVSGMRGKRDWDDRD